MSINGVIQGIDISIAQAGIDFDWVANQGFDFVYVEGELGNDGPDALFDQFIAGVRAVGLAPGAYLFFYPLGDDPKHPGRSPEEQVNAQFELTQGLGGSKGELPPMFDFEWPPPTDWKGWNDTAPLIRDKCLAAVERARALWGVNPVVYTEPWFWKSVLTAGGDFSGFSSCPLFVAGETPTILDPWTCWTLWQHLGSEVYPKGCGETDRDIFNGTQEQFLALIAGRLY